MKWTRYRRVAAPRLLLISRLGAGWTQYTVAGVALVGAATAGWRVASAPGSLLAASATAAGLRLVDRRADGAQRVLLPLPAGVTEAQARRATHGLPVLDVHNVLGEDGAHLAVVCRKRDADVRVEPALAAAGLR